MDNYYYQVPVPPKKQNSMETAALVLGIISLVTSCCIYLSFPCGALAVILGFLSQGKNAKFSPKAKTAIILGVAGIVAALVMLAAMFIFTFASGEMNWDAFMKEYQQMYEYYYQTYETL